MPAILKQSHMLLIGLFLWLFPQETAHGPSYYDQKSRRYQDFMPGFRSRNSIRAGHAWSPPPAAQKLPVED